MNKTMTAKLTRLITISLFLLISILSTTCTPTAVSIPYHVKKSEKISPFGRIHKKELEDKISELVFSVNANLNIGIKIVSTRTKEVIFEKNSEHLFTPASNVKLFTALAGITILGPNYRYFTGFYADSISGGSIQKNLYLRGSGDPDFTTMQLRAMVEDLKLRGIKTVQGDIVVDNFIFDNTPRGPGWMWDDDASSHFAPVDAMTLNDNCVKVYISPGKNINDPPIVQLEPATHYVKTVVKALTVPDSVINHQLKVERRWKTGENVIEVSGTIPLSSRLKSYTFSIENPSLYTGTVLKELLINNNISFGGTVQVDTVPSKAILLTSYKSKPLGEIISSFLKTSDNLTGELLLKTIGAVTRNPPGTWNNGLKAVKTFFQDEVKIDTTKLVLADGSGISRYNLVSPSQVVQILLWAFDNFPVFPEFLSALSIAGTDGTLENRITGQETKMKIRAKTGTLQGISALSGYVVSLDKEVFAFSILMSGFVGDINPYHNLQDNIVKTLTGLSLQ